MAHTLDRSNSGITRMSRHSSQTVGLSYRCREPLHVLTCRANLQVDPVTLRFNTGEVRAVDLEAFLLAKSGAPDSAYRNPFDPHTFCQARLDAESRTVCWNGLAREISGEGKAPGNPQPIVFVVVVVVLVLENPA
jgi:hypothetical protein